MSEETIRAELFIEPSRKHVTCWEQSGAIRSNQGQPEWSNQSNQEQSGSNQSNQGQPSNQEQSGTEQSGAIRSNQGQPE
jgi:hypothetical protein